jgi:hypothetical protein
MLSAPIVTHPLLERIILLICETGQIIRRTKCQSGAEKKKKRQRLEAAAQSQKAALNKFG